MNAIHTDYLAKYNVPGPRYTSYPTVPYWQDSGLQPNRWLESVKRSFVESNDTQGISVYIHLPFCESLCTFCGCNKRITRNHRVEPKYIEAVLNEWFMYCRELPSPPVIKDLHLGGGTPTFFSPENLQWLIEGIMSKAKMHPSATFGFEGHPNNTTEAHLKTLHNLGFKRLSLGIQDFTPHVQTAINRHQSYQQVEHIVQMARKIGYTSINFDVVYGLPFQQETGLKDTFHKIGVLKPDRIAFYSYAHVPWIKGLGQRKFTEADLPSPGLKLALYAAGRDILQDLGYEEIGMDHFALPTDELSISSHQGTLHRNFMGYTPSATQLMIGLGVSSIGDTWYGFAQNEKEVEAYYEQIQAGRLPVFRGHSLTPDELVTRQHILNIMCRFETSWPEHENMSDVLSRLTEMESDGLVEISGNRLVVTPTGRPYIRNVCMAFDRPLWANQPTTRVFSQTI